MIMGVFFLLLTNLFPLYIIIELGFIAGRFFNVDRETLANLVIYVCVPVVIFGFIVQLELEPEYALLPFIVYGIMSLVGFSFLKAGKVIFKDNRANLVSMCAAMANTGYFGLPLAILLFDEKWLGVYMFLLLGGILYEGTFGYYIAARGRFNIRDSFIKLAKFPNIYAVVAGVAVNLSHVSLPEQFFTYWTYFKGTYVIIGMMNIGASLSKVQKLIIAPGFVGLAFLGKFVVWPGLAMAFIGADNMFFHLFGPEIHKMLIVISIVPPAANIAAFAAQMDLRAEKAATTVLLGTLFALLYIPLVLAILDI